MLKHQLLHPGILEALGRAGHGSRVLIADGNYPASTTLGPNAALVSLNLSPGVVTCTAVLAALVTAIPIESAAVMQYAKSGPHALHEDPPIWEEFRRVLEGAGVREKLDAIERFEFYRTAGQADTALVITTGDQRIYANLMLTIGVVAGG